MSGADDAADPNYSVSDAACQGVRDRIVALGKQLVDAQGHYLWGGGGEKPSDSGSCKFSTVVLDASNPAAAGRYPTFNAAEINGCVCAGRYQHDAVKGMAPRQKVTDTSDAQVLKFCQGVTAKDQYTWKKPLTPRLIVGYTGADSPGEPMDYSVAKTSAANPGDRDNRSLIGKVVWGEGCGDTQHFDCGGFVGFVLKTVTGNPVPNIKNMASKNNPCVRVLGEGDVITPGDILYYKGHVAFALAGGKLTDTTSGVGKPYTTGMTYEVLQAESAVYGLNYGKPRGGHVGCVRLSRYALGVSGSAATN